jgi:proline-specific peptidase
MDGRLVETEGTRIFVAERGDGPLPLFVIHGGPGLDHTMFGAHLDGLTDACRLLFIDLRSQGRSDPAPPETWTLEQMAADVAGLAGALGLERYAVLGHSFGAFVALQHAVDFPDGPAASIVSAGVPDARFLEHVERSLASFEPEELREQVTRSWAREAEARTQEDCRELLVEQLPFHFRDPRDPRIASVDVEAIVFSPDVVRAGAQGDYGSIAVEDRLAGVAHPLLVLAGRHDRACSVEAAEAIHAGVPGSELLVFEDSAHMIFIEEEARYVAAVRDFLERRAG